MKSIFAYLPNSWQIILKQFVFAWKIKLGRFITDEPEFSYIKSVIHDGDNVVDIGASVGVYTLRFSELCGESGRVYAFEPVPESFRLLTANVRFCRNNNVTLFNIGIIDAIRIASIAIPRSKNGLRNYYRARVTDKQLAQDFMVKAFCCPLDLFNFPGPIRLVKIDVEGHEEVVLRGMRNLIERDRPLLIVESNSSGIYKWLAQFNYRQQHLSDSPNDIFHC